MILKDYLKDNLQIKIIKNIGQLNTECVIKITLEGEVITEDSINI